jgi:hypothetical protein
VRIPTLVLLLSLPAVAVAQTPADIARQVWPAGAPPSANVAPAANATAAGAFGPRDIARQLWPQGAPGASPNNAPLLATTGAFGPTDLARLRGDAVPAFLPRPQPAYATARRD